MTAPPRYKAALVDGRIRIFRSDGQDISQDEVVWVQATLTAQLRSDHLALNAKQNNDAVLSEPNVYEGTSPRTGMKVFVHPLIHHIKHMLRVRHLRHGDVSRILGKSSRTVSTWLRGEAMPSAVDLYALFGMLRYRLTPVPLDVLEQVTEIIGEHEKRELAKLEAESVGE